MLDSLLNQIHELKKEIQIANNLLQEINNNIINKEISSSHLDKEQARISSLKLAIKIRRNKISEIEHKIYKLQNPDLDKTTSSEIKTRKWSRGAILAQRKKRHSWATSVMRTFGSKAKNTPHRRAKSPANGSKFTSTSNSIKVIYTPMGGKKR